MNLSIVKLEKYRKKEITTFDSFIRSMLNASINFFLHVHDDELFGGNFFLPRIHVCLSKLPYF